jgi:hypothetical protein
MVWGGGIPLGGPGGAWGVNLGLAGVGPALAPPEPASGRSMTPTPPFWPFVMGRECTGDRGVAEALPF